MRIELPTVPQKIKETYDGSSFPAWWSFLSKKIWGIEQWQKAKKAGYLHDYLTDVNRHKKYYNRLLYGIEQLQVGVNPVFVACNLLGLTLYDLSPKWLQKILKNKKKNASSN